MAERVKPGGKVLGIAVAAVALSAGLVVFAGCEEGTPTAQEQTQQTPVEEHASMDDPSMDHSAMGHSQDETVAGEQTICPIMGNPIDKDVFVEYEGKKVYFCCTACIEKFNADPEKYIAKLPQFEQ